jgi:hypothetical protein
MIGISVVSAIFFVAVSATPETSPSAGVFDSAAPAAPAGQIDRLVFARLASQKIQPVLCSDAVFVRRVYLDVIGTLPTAKEARDFIADPDAAGKRGKLIDRLLERSEFADYWAMKWGDVLRIKAEFPVNLWPNAAQAYHRWVRSSIAANKPYDKFVREMLTSSGSNFRVAPVNFYRAIQVKKPEGIASAVALTFMGSRIDSWPKDRAAGTAVFFSQVGYKPTREWKEEDVFWDPYHTALITGATDPNVARLLAASAPASDGPLTAIFPDGAKCLLPGDRDPRDVFADWLITPKNPWFTRAIVNRVWAWLLGRGIIHEPDDIRDGNPPSNPELLAYLEKEMATGGYDLKKLYRLILNSSTYQLSSLPPANAPKGGAAMASYPLRRLEAEVLIDAINKITGASDLYTSPIPEPFTYIPNSYSAVEIPDGSITSPFLALFGRSARATGMENERDNKVVPAQWLHLLNSSHIQRKLEQGANLKAIIDSPRKPSDIVEDLYLTILSRYPTPQEVRSAEGYGATTPPSKTGKSASSVPTKRREDWIDITWSLINSTEFLFRH